MAGVLTDQQSKVEVSLLEHLFHYPKSAFLVLCNCSVLFCFKTVLLCSGWLPTQDPSASVFPVLGLQARATMLCFQNILNRAVIWGVTHKGYSIFGAISVDFFPQLFEGFKCPVSFSSELFLFQFLKLYY
jgi:hypothetical protein